MTARFTKKAISGWGRLAKENCNLFRPESRSDYASIFSSDGQPDFIAYGLGRSYGDSAINGGGGVILQGRLNRFIAFDQQTGEFECEAGVTFAEIIEHLLPRGFFLPVTPGTKFVTVGGAIAADVHGKNHHVHGTFSRFLRSLTLLLADGNVMTCSPEQNADVFWATVGGMGLTGIILTARFSLLPVQSAYIRVQYRRAPNIDSALEISSSGAGAARYSVAWIDCLSSGSALGRSVIMSGEHVAAADLPEACRSEPFAVRVGHVRNVPFDFPSCALNHLSVRAFNSVYYARHSDGTSVVDYDSFFYPLDCMRNWQRIYGKKGFIQYQALLRSDIARRGLIDLLEAVVASQIGSFLAVLKITGPAGRGLLSYPFEGYTLALDLPNRGPKLLELTGCLDRILLKFGGRLYLAKDMVTTAQTFKAMYPSLPNFLEVKHRVDPGSRFSSSQSRRLGITVRS